MILQFIFWFSVLAVFHTYVLYPWILESRKVSPADIKSFQDIPQVDILIAAYNEERVIQDKLESILKGDYPLDKLRIIIGSDGSNDNTHQIIEELKEKYSCLELVKFTRSGKTPVVNKLVALAASEIIILTDANVIFTSDTISQLVRGFSTEEIGLVGANIKSRKASEEGITHQENEYLERENRMKLKEGQLWGTMMGAFGGCYAMRRKLFVPVPAHFLVDDFHISMSVLKQGFSTCLAENALCLEDISSKLSEEFRRKVRMSTGNFQNLKVFSPFLLSKRKGLSFSFLSHKVLRWLTPLFLIISFLISWALSSESVFFKTVFYIQLVSFCIPFIEMSLDAIGIRSKFIRFITYFMSMNLALLLGMFKSFAKITKATWEPTERNL